MMMIILNGCAAHISRLSLSSMVSRLHSGFHLQPFTIIKPLATVVAVAVAAAANEKNKNMQKNKNEIEE